MSNANIGWLFYKDYFSDINYSNLEDKSNEKTIEAKVKNILLQTPSIEDTEVLGNAHFKATTTYPGLILGSGNAHELPGIKGQAILGFSFDYTSGLPIISGSSIKGVLRSAFKHTDYIKEYLDDSIDVTGLEKEIFDNRDIFFDANIIEADGLSKILGDDFLAPHGEDLLKNPVPLRFIKVLPNITFRFDFELNDGVISKSSKLKLFQNILDDLGLGAKTNVGYGKFTSFLPYKTKEEVEQEKHDLVLKKEQEELQRQKLNEELKKQKVEKAQGISELKNCKDIKTAMKIINESLGKKASPTVEQKEFIENFWKKQKNKAPKSEVKFFKKFISI